MVVKKRGLGKGLSALIPEESQANLFEESSRNKSVVDIDILLIEANEDQPRRDFKKESLDELKNSIKQYGVIQPIVVRKKDKKYEIIAGERRWRAAKRANLKKVPCIVKKVDDKQAVKLALIENIQRENLNPIEEAYAFKGLIEDYSLTQEEVSQAVGKSRSYIANTLRLLNLDKEIIDYVSKGKITSGHGKALLGIKDKKERLGVAKSIIDDNLNVRETEGIVKNKSKKKEKEKSKPKAIKRDPFVKDIEENLMRALGTKVTLTTKKSGGKIEIEFYGNEDLERIIGCITTE